jgi:ribosomal protein S18 acetylase RimI-like enzyme
MEVTVPPMAETDDLVELWIRLAKGQRAYGSHLRADKNRARIRESITRHVASDHMLVARDEDLLGFVMFRIEQGNYEQDITRGVVENLFVRSERRNEGIGTRLLQAAEQSLSELGVETVAVETMANNEDARRFYREHGYSPHRIELEKPIQPEKTG